MEAKAQDYKKDIMNAAGGRSGAGPSAGSDPSQAVLSKILEHVKNLDTTTDDRLPSGST